MSSEAFILDIDAQKTIIYALSKRLRACHVYPDIAEQVIAKLENCLDKGEYTDIRDGDLFALAVTMHMQEVNHDEHLWVRWHPEPLPDAEGQLRLEKEWQEQQRVKAGLENYGLHKLERLPGNVGYMDIHYFHRSAWGAETVGAALSFLTNMNSLIIDLRECTGGYADMIALFSSYFFEGPPIHLNSIYWRDDDITQEYWTSSDIPGKRFIGKPVYLLVSKKTFSAGEGFASILQAHKRAVVIGEKTDGGAHAGASYRIHPHFEAFIPVGRAFDPLSGKDLEGIGVLPDICLPQAHAYLAAYHLALKGILEGADASPLEPCRDVVEEAATVLKDQKSNHRFCPKCDYPNLLAFSKCKNCDEPMYE